jgi:hypothetical protein
VATSFSLFEDRAWGRHFLLWGLKCEIDLEENYNQQEIKAHLGFLSVQEFSRWQETDPEQKVCVIRQ